MTLPALSAARCDPVHEVEIVDALGERRVVAIPAEHALTVWVDKREVVTLMTLGAHPEWLVLGYLLNQGLVDHPSQIAAVQVDWSVDAAAVVTHDGLPDLDERREHRIVTTGCGQGTAYARQFESLDALRPPRADWPRVGRGTLGPLFEALRAPERVHRRAGSVHGCALGRDGQALFVVEDVGRHNAIDTLAGWMAMHGVAGDGAVLATTGRLTSEMVIKAARMGIAVVASRNGITQMGHALAQRLGLTLIGRAAGRQFLCYSGFERFEPEALATEVGDAA